MDFDIICVIVIVLSLHLYDRLSACLHDLRLVEIPIASVVDNRDHFLIYIIRYREPFSGMRM